MANKPMGSFSGGKDAAEITPKLVPDDELLPRDNSGGIDFEPHTGQFGDGGYVAGGQKAALSVSGGGLPQNNEIAERKVGESGNRKR